VVTEPGFRHDGPGTGADTWSGLLADRAVPSLDLGDATRRVVVVGAHPDDESLGASGLMHLAAGAGWDVEVVCVTAGEGSHPRSATVDPRQLATIRRAELDSAVRSVARYASIACLDLPDGSVGNHVEEVVDQLVATIGVDGSHTLLCAPWRADGHPDHEAVGRAAAIAAARTDARLLQYPVWLWHWGSEHDLPWSHTRALPLRPEGRGLKRTAIAAHRSQVAPLSAEPGDEVLLTAAMLAHFDRDFEVFVEEDVAAVDDVLERVHRERPDPWSIDSAYERRKRAVTLACLPDEHYPTALEVGCSIGALAVDLAGRVDRLLALDASPTAVDAARERTKRLGHVDVRLARVPSEWPEGSFDLVSISEVGYFLSPRQLDQVVALALASLSAEGHLLLCHWRHQPVGWPLAGPAVHEAFLAAGARVVVEHHEDDFLLHVLARST
jgi:LmbE family N-acetylglucosaminyl deacetylase